MDLATAKAKVWQILDEYSSGGTVVEDDDIKLKLNNFFDIAQKQLAQKKRIVKMHTLVIDNTGANEYTEYAMPTDFYALKQAWADYAPVSNGIWRNKKLLLPTDESRKIEIEYYAYPSDITTSTLDTYEFEIDKDAQECMPYWVASNCVITDLVVDYQKILGIYNQMLNNLFDTDPKPAIKVVQL